MVTLREICIASMPFTTLGTDSRAARITGIVLTKKWKIDCSVGIAADPRLRGAQGPRLRARCGRTLSVPRSLVFGVGSIRDERGAMWLRSWSRMYNLAFISACVKVICGMCLRYGFSIVGNCRGTFRVWCRCVDLYVSWGRIKILFSPAESQKEARPFSI
jgi:hypothetical protein